MKAKREARVPEKRGSSDRRRAREGSARTSGRPAADSAATRRSRTRVGNASAPTREARSSRSGPQTSPITRPVERSARAKSTNQAKARAKARKAKAPKAIRPKLSERLATRLASIDLRPRTLATKVPFVVLVIGSLGMGLALTLWLSTDSAERSYQLSHAREKTRMLQQQKEALERDVREAESAPALAEAARKQGMIPTRDTAHLVQAPDGSWVVVGTPKPADGVPPPPLNTKLPEEGPPPPPKPPAVPAEVPVLVLPAPGGPAGPPRSGPEALLRAPDGASTLGGQHLSTQAGPGLPGAAPGQLPGLPGGAVPGVPPAPGQLPAAALVPAEVPVPLQPGLAPPARPSPSSGACAGAATAGRADAAERRTVRPGRHLSAGGATVRRGDSRRARPSQPARGRRRNPVAGEVGKPKRLRKAEKAGKAKVPKKPAAGARAEAIGRSARERRTRQVVEAGTRGASFVFRHRAGNVVIIGVDAGGGHPAVLTAGLQCRGPACSGGRPTQGHRRRRRRFAAASSTATRTRSRSPSNLVR